MRQKIKQLKNILIAAITILILIVSTVLCFIPILFVGLFKLIPIKAWQIQCTKIVDAVATFWIMINNGYLSSTQNVKWEVEGAENLKRRDWYLVVANHQSWLDIVVLQRVFNRRIPVLKFFIKSQLKWVPLLGFSWWAMGCPFMKRYSSSYLKRKPHKKGQDLIATKKACQGFSKMPVSITNFVEGSRFSQLKKEKQESPYKHLLKPKAGGIAFILNSMGEQINTLLDVTIIYPKNHKSLWDFLCHRISKVKVIINKVNIPMEFIQGDYFKDSKLQQEFRQWLNQHWQQKDLLIEANS